jgi:antitoxin CptB
MSETAERARLHWRCRRGMRELDLMLLAWLEARYPTACERERRAFEALLALEDDRLWTLLRGQAEAESEAERQLCHEIRALARDRG